MRKILLLLVCILSMHAFGQEKLRVSLKVGAPLEFDVSDIKEISFFDEDSPLSLYGEWLCVSQGVFETFDFLAEGKMYYYVYYMSIYEASRIEGKYTYNNGMLTVTIGKLGTLTFPITSYSDTRFVTTSAGVNSTYYKVLKNYEMTTADSPISVGNDGDRIIFVDNAVVTLEDNKIKALAAGSGYVLVEDSKLNTIVAYRINVSGSTTNVVDFTQYFKKTKEEIIAELGNDYTSFDYDDQEMMIYQSGYNADVSDISFVIDKKRDSVIQVSITPRGVSQYNDYQKTIAEKYVLLEEMSTKNNTYYIDSDDFLAATVLICFQQDPILMIIYMDMMD